MPTDGRAPARRPADNERSGRRAQLIELLRGSTLPRSIADLAEAMGVHVNTVRFHLDTLTADGRVERVLGKASGPGRPPASYRLSAGMHPYGPTNYRLLARMLTSNLAASATSPARTATDLGRTWGPTLLDESNATPAIASSGAAPRVSKKTALARMVDVLTDLGFEPEQRAGSRTVKIRLRHCPFIDLVDEHAEIICSLHLGLMQGAFGSMKAPVTVDRLVPFEQPDLCVAHLTPVSANGQRTDTKRVSDGSGS